MPKHWNTQPFRDKKRHRNEFELAKALRASEYSELRRPPEPAHKFEVSLEEDSCTREKFELFQNYQQHVHHEGPDETSWSGFKNFLCNSPLIRENVRSNVTGRTKKLGSYHQMYRLDGRLIAMGFLDLLPHCVSGVYFIYHSDFEGWSFGKLSALREANLALQEDYGYYYMGYYIHSCQKMRYKGEYQPQFFLDLDTYGWEPLDEQAKALMLSQKHVSMSRERRKQQQQQQQQEQPANGGAGAGGGPLEAEAMATSPAEVEALRLSALAIGMPGVLTAEQVEAQCDLDNIKIRVGSGSNKITTVASVSVRRAS